MSFASERYSDYPAFISKIYHFADYWDTQIHAHTAEELLLLTSKGTCMVVCNGDVFKVTTPAFIWNRAGSYHMVVDPVIDWHPSYLATFPTKLLTDMPKELKYHDFIEETALFAMPLSDSRLPRLETLFASLIDSPMAQRAPLLSCIFHQVSLYLKSGAEVVRTTGNYGYIFKVLSLLEQPENKSLTTADLAALFHVSKAKLEKDFKRCTGHTIHAFKLQVQLQYARLQITTTTKPLAQIASDCGFTDESHLIRSFKKEYGQTPGTYRRNYRNRPR